MPVLQSVPAASSRAGEAYGRLPLSFEPNVGQAGVPFQFLARGSGYGLFLSPTGAVLVLARAALGEKHPPSETPRQEQRTTAERHGPSSGRRSLADNRQPPLAEREVTALRVDLVGAAPEAAMTGRGELPGRMNYFKGSDPAQWRANVPTFSSVAVEGVYPGIDLVYYGNQRQLEYDFVVAPGADPARITLAWQGAEEVKVDAHGDLVLRTKAGEVRQHKPIVYQDVGGVRQEISGRYTLRSGPATASDQAATRVGFEVAAYDRERPLVIDPVLSYSSFLGGEGRERGWDIAADSEGNAYVTGVTLSTNFPVADALQANFGGGFDSDMFVMKLDASGTNLVYSTYLGGTTEDAGFAIAVDAAGNAYVTGLTTSTNFPTANAFQSAVAGTPPRGLTVHPFDVVVLKLNPTGSALVYSTYLGGSGEDEGIGIAVDSTGSAYVTGQTTSTDFPTANPLQAAPAGAWEAFVTKLSPDGTALVYSTYLGGLAEDYGEGVAVDSAGGAYVTGITGSTDFPTTPDAVQTNYNGGFFDAFATKLNAGGTALVYSTYLGGTNEDQGLRVALDAAGSAHVTGYTFSTNFPTTPDAVQPQLGGFTNELVAADAFVTKLNATGSALVYSTYLGGDSTDEGWDIAVDALGNAYVGGLSLSTNFPVTANALLSTNAGSFDAFITMLSPSGAALTFSTLLGGNLQDDAYGIDVDGAGNIYVTGRTISTNFPTALPLRPTPPDNFFDLFVARIAPDPMLNVARAGNTVTISCLHSLAGFALEAAESLAAPVTWTPVTATPTRNGLYDTIVLDALNGGQYFRLRRP
ncbi:MAG: SBBP repeat-containing protein [Verrucomicrobia bacterium]|nr:SBBP repeat-containing protein [Verrucomicrobiota bacterium]